MKTNLIRIEGEWDLGYVLDKHILSSTYLGVNEQGRKDFDNVRTEVGEAIYQLKYNYNLKKIDVLAKTFAENMKVFFNSAGFIIPMPPSKKRAIQPLTKLAKRVSLELKIPIFKKILVKNGQTPELKNIDEKEKRIKALMGVLELHDKIPNEGCWDVLLIDDIYDFGASTTAATRMLRKYSKVNKIYVAAFTKTART